jgi:acyl-CoA synthetase (AMP-forming)/AMP-acid ligase II
VNAAQVMNLGQLLTQTARLFPERAALIQEGGRTWTWGEMEQRVAAMTAALRGSACARAIASWCSRATTCRCSKAAGSPSASAASGCRPTSG